MSTTRGYSVQRPFEYVRGNGNHPRHDSWDEIYVDPKQNCCRCDILEFKCTVVEARKIIDLQNGYYRNLTWSKDSWQIPFMVDLCPEFTARYELVALIGAGSFGVVYAARAFEGDPTRRYAVKFESRPMAVQMQRVFDNNGDDRRFTDGLPHALLEPSNVVAPLIGIYVHGALICMVMELFGGVTVDLNNLPANPNRRVKPRVKPPRLRTCTGEKFGQIWEGPRTQLKQIEVCRIFWHLVGGFAEMAAAGVSHNDFASRNYLVDYEFRAKIIDFGLAILHPSENDFNVNRPNTVRSPWDYHTQHYLAWQGNLSAHTPEYLNYGLAPRDERRDPERIWDLRRSDLWAFAVCLYEALHGGMPWRHEYPGEYSNEDFILVVSDPRPVRKKFQSTEGYMAELKAWKRAQRYLKIRNDKVVNAPLPVREDLDQDLVDVLQALFVKDPLLRCDVRDLVTFPWFQGWQEDAGHTFYNPITEYGVESPVHPDEYIRARNARMRAAVAADDSIDYDNYDPEEFYDDDPYMVGEQARHGGLGKE